jgi:hypothetical protein
MRIVLAVLLSTASLLVAGAARGQTTDGYHSVQVFPVVVDTASFAQRFNFRNPTGVTLTLQPTYLPAIGTSQASALECPTFNILPNRTLAFNSLREICPALAAGSQFGFLSVRSANFLVLPFAGFSRVANPQGNGFTVEAFAASEFTSADGVINGLRRSAATPSAPAFQTNCFLGLVNNLDADLPLANTPINYFLFNSAGTQIGSGQQTLIPGKIVRLLDIFATAGAAAGDYDNAMLKVFENGPDEPGVMAFCTVQDNTSFGADFRIAKQEVGDGGEDAIGGRVVGPQTIFGRRELLRSQDGLGRAYTIPAGAGSNTHVIRLHSADYGFCEIIDPNTGVRALPAYGLELRAIDPETGETGAGGNDSTVVPDPNKGEGNYFGDRADGGLGDDQFGFLEVESNEQNTGVPRPYKLHCRSGSGISGLDIVRYQEAVDRF